MGCGGRSRPDCRKRTLISGVNEAFDQLKAHKGPNAWYPWDLVTVDKNQGTIVKVKKIFKTCNLSDGKYGISIGPEPGNWNIQGQLGGRCQFFS